MHREAVSQTSPLALPSTATAFPSWTAIDSLCRRNWVERGSLDDCEMRLPSSFRNCRVDGPIAPEVSMATGCTRCCGAKCAYLSRFLSSAIAATQPASVILGVNISHCNLVNALNLAKDEDFGWHLFPIEGWSSQSCRGAKEMGGQSTLEGDILL